MQGSHYFAQTIKDRKVIHTLFSIVAHIAAALLSNCGRGIEKRFIYGVEYESPMNLD
jgi:hypothetical protein